MAAATSVNSLGNGVFATIGTLYFLRFAGLSVARVGVRTVFLGLLLVSAGAVAAYVGVRGWTPFLVVAVVAVSAERSTAGIRNAFIAQVVDGSDRVRTRAYLRSVTNVGAAVVVWTIPAGGSTSLPVTISLLVLGGA